MSTSLLHPAPTIAPTSEVFSDPDEPLALRLAEWVMSALLALLAAPVLAVLWVAVRLSSRGPGIYSQRRTGLRGRQFQIHKLRTMAHNCEKSTGAVWSTFGDPRVTPLGAILRTTHLDELPQLVNVLRGQMALVGPRPERPEIIERIAPLIPGYLERLRVRPGVTGLAQIFWGSDATLDDVRRKIEIDRLYIANRTVWLDLRILACTALKVVKLNSQSVRRTLFPHMARQIEAILP